MTQPKITTAKISAVHYERDSNGTATVTVILPDGRELVAISDQGTVEK